MSQNQSVVEWAKNTPLDQMGEVLKIVAERLDQHRTENKGYTPKPIFEHCLGIGGVYVAVEIVLMVIDPPAALVGIALKKRGADESSWAGKYQITGVAGRRGDTDQTIMNRLSREIFGDEDHSYPHANFNPIDFLGIETHYEPERKCDCQTSLWRLELTRVEFGQLPGEWKVFGVVDLGSEEIVDHHRNTLSFVLNHRFKSALRRL